MNRALIAAITGFALITLLLVAGGQWAAQPDERASADRLQSLRRPV